MSKSSPRATFPRSVNFTPRSVNRPARSGPTKPIASNTRSASSSKSEPSTLTNLPSSMVTSCARSALTRPSVPTNASVLTENTRSPPSSCAADTRYISG
ncbi:Uncharacterised protein [Mycobacterium tuberculosis]|uniref:Uncharacterized protein n=1 Tax=Mycobacterium tuberculosis TaxID=1773 RepID=A0A654TEL7_MYCTX|nr:Uncharacterised protein [Mycobacterium tuberculosis]CFE67956.1 Uncharacterised protein [Mycobacterium tuberculosis]CKR34169.1 Uncharacterised protein [Mycobacterium tuberculosis]CNU15695.1 Uncharacterised protein [Mycobacterium tuberculosis]COW29003.1 Uncharacterised protein [Mycobacterium tuberculosis]